ncbi:MAG: NTP transferase domain-containing protein [Candidatus Margulisbacteria bacterium]|nr:NTP transferase domain-containing protein [Candidatus Margulisiibacteriota bacterium]
MILAIIQARMGATRLPGKVLLDLEGKLVLERVIDRVKAAKLVDEVMVATTSNEKDKPIVAFCNKIGIKVFAGSEDDVLDRYYQAALEVKPDHVVRITADCPLMDPNVIDAVIKRHLDKTADYTANIIEAVRRGLPCRRHRRTGR